MSTRSWFLNELNKEANKRIPAPPSKPIVSMKGPYGEVLFQANISATVAKAPIQNTTAASFFHIRINIPKLDRIRSTPKRCSLLFQKPPNFWSHASSLCYSEYRWEDY